MMGQPQLITPFQKLRKGQFWNESRQTISSSLSAEIVRQRLNSLFSSPLDLSDFSTFGYGDGHINGNTLRIEYVKYGRGTIRYDITGQIFNNPGGGSKIELIISGRNLWWSYLSVALFGFFVPIFFSAGSGMRGFASWLMMLLVGLSLAVILTLIYLAVDFGIRKSILGNIGRILQKNIQAAKRAN